MKRPCKIKITSEVHCTISGLDKDHIDYFYNQYGKYVPNYFFQPRYKFGQWDGKIRYFHKSGKTFVFLLDEIVPKLSAFGYAINVVDQRTSEFVEVDPIDKDYFSAYISPRTEEPYELAAHQVTGTNLLLEHGNGILIGGTGAGKTLITAAITDVYGKKGLRVITIVPLSTLIGQTVKEYRNVALDVGEYSGDLKDLNHQHIVSTWQALKNRPELMEQFDGVIVDECQGLEARVLSELLLDHGDQIPLRFGVTGTLPKAEADSTAVITAVGPVRFSIPAHELIDIGWLASLHISAFQLVEDFKEQYEEFQRDNPVIKKTYTQFKDQYFPDYQAEKSYLQRKEARLQWIADLIEARRSMRKGNVMCLVTSVPFGKKLQKYIPNSVFLYGKDKDKVRQQVYELFESSDDLVVICTVQIAGIGLSIDRIFNLVLVDIGKSFIRTIQAIGRGLRKGRDKDHVDVIDVCSDLKYSKGHLRDRKKYYREQKYPFQINKVEYTE